MDILFGRDLSGHDNLFVLYYEAINFIKILIKVSFSIFILLICDDFMSQLFGNLTQVFELLPFIFLYTLFIFIMFSFVVQ